jgi:hypothetical protein
MLSLLLLHIIISLSSLVAGFLFYQYIIRSDHYEKANRYRPVIFYFITGLIILTFFTQVYILFFPASVVFRCGMALLLILTAAASRKTLVPFLGFILREFKSFGLSVKLALVACWYMILVINAGPVMMDDTDSYHIQMVKWIQEYGSVPGIANLHRRFGFNSAWFSSIALFSFEWQGYNFFTALNGVLSFWLAGYLLLTATILLQKTTKDVLLAMPLFFVLVVSLALWPVLRGNAASSNYDFISLLIIFVLFAETIRASSQTKEFLFSTEWIIWPVYLFTVRIINFPFLLLSVFAFFLLLQKKQRREAALFALLGLVLVIPFFARNVIVSGYLFYPSLSFDWFTVDWKADKEKTIALLKYIKYYNRVSTGYLDIDDTAALGFPAWIAAWFKYMFTYNKMMFIPGLAGLILSPFLLLRKKESGSAIIIFLVAVMTQTIVWFITAPDPRFIYGCLFAGILTLFLLLKNVFDIAQIKKAFPFLLSITAWGIIFFAAVKSIRSETSRNWVLTAKLPDPPVTNISVDGIEMHIPEAILNNWNPRCYATDLPCLYEVDPRLQARGQTIADGFKLKK